MDSMKDRAVTKEQKRAVVERILRAWEQMPEQRLGQLIVNSVGGGDPFYAEDNVLVQFVEYYARTGKVPE